MPDREKAIRILEGNYKSFVLRHNGELITVNELLALLKAQEPKTVIGVAETYKDIWLGNCPSCNQSIVTNVNKQTKYCRFCGQAVKWE